MYSSSAKPPTHHSVDCFVCALICAHLYISPVYFSYFFLFPFFKCKISVLFRRYDSPTKTLYCARARSFVRNLCVCGVRDGWLCSFSFSRSDVMAIISIPTEVNGASERTSGEKKHPPEPSPTLEEVKICVHIRLFLTKAPPPLPR